MLSQRLVALRRDLAAAAWRVQEMEHDQRRTSPGDLERARRRVLNLGLEINQLESLLELAEHPELEIGQTIGPGTVIEVVDAASGQPAEYWLVGCEQDSDSIVVGVGSPIGQALLGRRLGSLVTLNLPDGMRRVRVVSTHPIGGSRRARREPAPAPASPPPQ
jgi:transcription elongation GreA/GreB family factor